MDLSRKKYKETGEKRTIISLVILSNTQNIKGYLIKEEEIDVRCTHGEKRNAYGILVGILKERPRRREEDNIKRDIKEV